MGQDHEAHKEFEFYPIKSSVLGRLVGYTVANETITDKEFRKNAAEEK